MTATQVENCKRERLRLEYLAAVEITTAEGRRIRGNIRDITIESIFVKLDTHLETLPKISERVEIAISVVQGSSWLTVGTPGNVLRCDKDGIALMFDAPLKWWPIFTLFPVNEQFMYDVVAQA